MRISYAILGALALASALPAAAESAVVCRPSAEFIGKLFGVEFSEDDFAKKLPRELWRQAAAKDELLADWLMQDAKLAPREEFTEITNAQSRVEAAMEAAGVNTKSVRDWPARVAAYRAIAAKRRAGRLAKTIAAAPRWVYARHYVMGGSHYAYTEAQSDGMAERVYHRKLSQLCLLEATKEGFWNETVLLESKDGVYRDVDVSFDGKKLLYSYKASDRDDDFHLYEMDLDTRQSRQITFSKGFADYEGCYLPNGQIVFNSTRPVQVVDCWWTEVSNIYRCEADGSKITRLTFDQVHDNYPTLCWDGRIFYTRWEYSDRSQMYPQPLFAMDWDGTNQRAVYGDNSWYPTTIVHARAVPGSQMFFGIGTGHHTSQGGDLLRFDPREGRQENEGAYQVGPLRRAKWEREDICGQQGPIALYPYPMSESQIMVSYLPEGWPKRKDPKDRQVDFRAIWEPFGIYWFNVDGSRELLVPRFGDRIPCGRMVPVRPRKRMFLKASGVKPDAKTGTFFVHDVYEGPAMQGVKRGDVKTLRVASIEYRPAGIGHNGNGGRGGGGTVSTPVAIGNGTWDPKIVIGDVPVEADGSCYFEAPVEKPLYFILLDEKGRMIQTMRSWTTLMPGENATCTGCHEGKNDSPPAANVRSVASQKGVRKLTPFWKEGPRGFSFLKDVQPILDRRCVSCHKAGSTDKPDLSNTPVPEAISKRTWTQGYLSLTHVKPRFNNRGDPEPHSGNADHKELNWVSAASEPTLIKPRAYGSNASTIFSERLDKGHCPGITGDELRMLAAWVDLGVPFCGTYDEASNWNEKERATYDRLLEKRKRSLENTPSDPAR